jgi:murein DD-endopeptidase MepM/ murein hydrolase activator NlpD
MTERRPMGRFKLVVTTAAIAFVGGAATLILIGSQCGTPGVPGVDAPIVRDTARNAPPSAPAPPATGAREPETPGRQPPPGAPQDRIPVQAPVQSADPLPHIDADPIADLRQRALDVPVENVAPSALTETFEDTRGTARKHEALDILAPRNTPVLAVEDGVIAKLFLSVAGGITIYQFDPTKTYAYYYAHLERYADNLKEGDRVRRKQVIGYVGTTGNAPEDTPHLHFAIFRLTEAKQWWKGTAIDPYLVLK